jgi:hypothetical protein
MVTVEGPGDTQPVYNKACCRARKVALTVARGFPFTLHPPRRFPPLSQSPSSLLCFRLAGTGHIQSFLSSLTTL